MACRYDAQRQGAVSLRFIVLFLSEQKQARKLLLKLLLVFVILVWCELQTSFPGAWTPRQADVRQKKEGNLLVPRKVALAAIKLV